MASYLTSVGNVSGLTLISTTTNNPPIQVSCSNLVSNLNGQFFNSQLASYYTNASNITSGILGVAQGGTGVSNMTTGYVHFGSNNALGQSSNLFWNNTSNFLGICTSNPASVLDINAGSNTSLSLRGSNTQQWIYPFSNAGIAQIGFSGYSNAQSNTWYLGQATGISNISNSFALYSTIIGNNSFTVLSNGYFGISNNNPLAPLDVILPVSNTYNVIFRGGLYRQHQIVPGTTITSNPTSGSNASEILFNWSNDWTNNTNCAAVGINTWNCGCCNFGFVAPGKGLAMTLQGFTGYVGIGNSNPTQWLDTSGVIRSQGFMNYYPIFVTFYLTNNVTLNGSSNLIPIPNFWTYSSNNSSTPTSITSSNFYNSNGFIFPYNGFYAITWMSRFSNTATENTAFFANSNQYNYSPWGGGRVGYCSTGSYGLNISFTGYFSSNDYLQPQVYSTSSNTLLTNNCGATYITIQLLIRST